MPRSGSVDAPPPLISKKRHNLETSSATTASSDDSSRKRKRKDKRSSKKRDGDPNDEVIVVTTNGDHATLRPGTFDKRRGSVSKAARDPRDEPPVKKKLRKAAVPNGTAARAAPSPIIDDDGLSRPSTFTLSSPEGLCNANV